MKVVERYEKKRPVLPSSAVHEWKKEGDFNITSTSATWCCCCCQYACRPVTSRKSCLLSEMIFRTMNEPSPQRHQGSKRVPRLGPQLQQIICALKLCVYVCERIVYFTWRMWRFGLTGLRIKRLLVVGWQAAWLWASLTVRRDVRSPTYGLAFSI